MEIKQSYTLEELHELFLAYDRANGEYPESAYEGLALWEWINTRKKRINADEYFGEAHVARYHEWKAAVKK